MQTVRVKNFRSIEDSGDIELKKINVAIGTNGTGKSSLLRLFPLLKQTLDKNIDGAIFWDGSERGYVDFGGFEQAINFNVGNEDNKENQNIEIEFGDTVTLNEIEWKIAFDHFFDNVAYPEWIDQNINQNMNIEIKSRCVISGHKKDNYDIMSDYIRHYMFYVKSNDQIYTFRFEFTELKNVKLFIQVGDLELETNNIGVYFSSTSRSIDKILSEVDNFIQRLIKDYYDDSLDLLANYLNQSNLNILNKIAVKNFEIAIASIGCFIIEFKNLIKSCDYIAPIRATSKRYYRLNNLSVDGISFQGENLAEFINALNDDQKNELNGWLENNFDFTVDVSKGMGHISLDIKNKDDSKKTNIVDTGFGYSQLLPIITQLWFIIYNSKKDKSKKLFIMEQPEVHLHPALQAKFVDIIVKIVNEQDNLIIMLETHSDVIINRLGTNIYKEKISEKDVNVIAFSKKDNGSSEVKQIKYDEEGVINDWPSGFFAPEVL